MDNVGKKLTNTLKKDTLSVITIIPLAVTYFVVSFAFTSLDLYSEVFRCRI